MAPGLKSKKEISIVPVPRPFNEEDLINIVKMPAKKAKEWKFFTNGAYVEHPFSIQEVRDMYRFCQQKGILPLDFFLIAETKGKGAFNAQMVKQVQTFLKSHASIATKINTTKGSYKFISSMERGERHLPNTTGP